MRQGAQSTSIRSEAGGALETAWGDAQEGCWRGHKRQGRPRNEEGCCRGKRSPKAPSLTICVLPTQGHGREVQ